MGWFGRLADGIFIAVGSFCLLFLGFNVLQHGWTLHYLVLILVGLVLVAVSRMRTMLKVNLALLLFSTVVSAYAGEAFVGYVLFSHTRFKATDWMNFPFDWNTRLAVDRFKEEKYRNAGFDMRPRMEVIQDLRSRGVHAVPHVFPTILFDVSEQHVWSSRFTVENQELLPLGGLSRSTTVLCNESGEYLIYDADEYGFHNPIGLWKEGVQVLALGDSFIHGACVPSKDNLVSVIRSRYPATISLGISGNGPLTELATLKEYGPFLKPKATLWFYYEDNDFRDLDTREKYAPVLMKYLEPSFSQHLVNRQEEIDRLLSKYVEDSIETTLSSPSFHLEKFLKLQHLRESIRALLEKKKTAYGVSTELVDQIRKDGAPAKKEDRDLYGRILQEANATVTAWGGQLYFVYLPGWNRYGIPELASQNRDAVLTLVHDLGLPTIDIHLAFANHPDPLSLFPSRRYAHYNVAGHKLAGEEVITVLVSQPTPFASSDSLLKSLPRAIN